MTNARPWLWAAVVIAGCAEKSNVRPAVDVAAESQRLIDEFIAAMPRSPAEMRKADVRAALAPKVLPILGRIRAFAAEHPECTFGTRVHEFTVYSLVLGEPGLRESITARHRNGDRDAGALLAAADTILAVDAAPREAAVGRFATSLREASGKPESAVASCAVFCLSIAGELNAEEAKRLADNATDTPLGASLRQIAGRAQNDAKNRLDQPIELAGTLADGTSFTTTSLRGKVVLVDFWATWCGPCMRVLPELVRVKQTYAAEGLAVVGVDFGSPRDKLDAFFAQHPEVDWPQLYAGGAMHPIANAWGVDRIPRLFLIDRAGILRNVDAAANLEELVRGYLRQ